jgi:ElaA protein
MSLQWKIKAFDALSVHELYDLLRLGVRSCSRANCVYLDLDGKDEVALHLIGEYEGEIVAHARLLNQELVLITLLLVEWL